MNRVQLKMLINEVLDENSEVALTNTNRLIDSATTVDDFLKKLVGKRLKDLLDMASFARLYVMNKYGVGSMPAEDDIQANVSYLLTSIVDYINFRKLDKMSIERDAFEKHHYNTPEYKEWHSKRNVAFKKLFMARRTSDQSVIDTAQTEYNDIMASEPNRDAYEKNRSDREQTVHEFHNRPLTPDDIMPQSDDSVADKQRYDNIVKAFNKLKNMNESVFTRLAKQMMVESMDETIINVRHRIKLKNMKKDGWSVDGWDNKKEGKIKVIRTNPKTNKMETGVVDRKGNFTLKENTHSVSTVQIYTGGNRGTTLLLYKGDARGTERSSDKHIKTPTQFMSLINSLDSTGDTAANEEIKNILKKLTSDELESLKSEKIIVTNNVEV